MRDQNSTAHVQLLLFLLAREVHRRTVDAVHAAATKFLPRIQLFSFFKTPSGGTRAGCTAAPQAPCIPRNGMRDQVSTAHAPKPVAARRDQCMAPAWRATRRNLKLYGIFFFGNWDLRISEFLTFFPDTTAGYFFLSLKNKFWTTSFTFPSHLPLFSQFYIQPSRPP
jgi:hypothetical protein